MKTKTEAIGNLLKEFLREHSLHRYSYQELLKREWLHLFPETKDLIKTFYIRNGVLYVGLYSRLMTHLVRERGMDCMLKNMREALAQGEATGFFLKRIALL